MKSYFNPISRRKFLKAGVTGGTIIATYPAWKLFAFSHPPDDFHINPAVNLSKETLDKLIEVALQREASLQRFMWSSPSITALLFQKT